MSNTSIYFSLNNTLDKHMAQEVKKALSGIPGVSSVAVGSGKDRVSVDYDDTGTTSAKLEKTLCDMGLDVKAESQQTHTM